MHFYLRIVHVYLHIRKGFGVLVQNVDILEVNTNMFHVAHSKIQKPR